MFCIRQISEICISHIYIFKKSYISVAGEILYKPCYVGPCHHGIARAWVADGGHGLQKRRVTANISNKQSRIADNWWSFILGGWAGEGLTTPYRKYHLVTKCYTGPRTWRALVNTIMNLRVPQKAENLLTSWVTIGFPRGTPLHGVS